MSYNNNNSKKKKNGREINKKETIAKDLFVFFKRRAGYSVYVIFFSVVAVIDVFECTKATCKALRLEQRHISVATANSAS